MSYLPAISYLHIVLEKNIWSMLDFLKLFASSFFFFLRNIRNDMFW